MNTDGEAKVMALFGRKLSTPPKSPEQRLDDANQALCKFLKVDSLELSSTDDYQAIAKAHPRAAAYVFVAESWFVKVSRERTQRPPKQL